MSRLPTVVALGGGHGLSVSLTALRRITNQLTAVVTVADDGGSSGRLRKEFDCLPPGDLRMALAALCGDDQTGRTWAAVLQSRFSGEGPLAGHAVGNLLIAGLWQYVGDAVAGLDMVGGLLHTWGRVLPMSSIPLSIEADVIGLDPMRPDEICTLVGQSTVASTNAEIYAVRLVPNEPPVRPEVVEAIQHADYVVLGPGSWFTSVIPHLLVPGLAQALVNTKAHVILNMNIAPLNETDGFSPSRHLEAIAEHAPKLRLSTVLADRDFVNSDPHLKTFAASLGAKLMIADLSVRDGTPRHDPNRLAAAFAEIMEITE